MKCDKREAAYQACRQIANESPASATILAARLYLDIYETMNLQEDFAEGRQAVQWSAYLGPPGLRSAAAIDALSALCKPLGLQPEAVLRWKFVPAWGMHKPEQWVELTIE